VISGTYGTTAKLPAVGGIEGVHQVIQLGAGASKFKIGDWVIPPAAYGSWRTEGVAAENSLLRVPSTLAPEYAAVLSVAPLTALRLLDDFAKLQPGDCIIQNGANSTTGQAISQLAAAMSVHSINVIRPRPDQAAVVESLKQNGATVVVTDQYLGTTDYHRLVKELPRPKLALNGVGGPSVLEMARTLAPGSTLVTYGGMSRLPVQVSTSALIFNDLTLRGFWLAKWADANSLAVRQAALDALAAMVTEGRLKLLLERHHLSDWKRALSRAQEPYKSRKPVMLNDLTK